MERFLHKFEQRKTGRAPQVQSVANSTNDDQLQLLDKHLVAVMNAAESSINSLSNLKNPNQEDTPPWCEKDLIRLSPLVLELIQSAKRNMPEGIGYNIGREERITIIRRAVQRSVSTIGKSAHIHQKDIDEAVRELISFYLGKGPLQPLFEDLAVTDIFLDGYNSIRCMRFGRIIETPFTFRTSADFDQYLNHNLQTSGFVLDYDHPTVYGILNDPWKTRIHAVHSKILASQESSVIFHIPRLRNITFYDLIRAKMLPSSIAAWLAELVSSAEGNILIMGPAGSGKTTFLSAILHCISPDERVCVVEDLPEVSVSTPHLERFLRFRNGVLTPNLSLNEVRELIARRSANRLVIADIHPDQIDETLRTFISWEKGAIGVLSTQSPKQIIECYPQYLSGVRLIITLDLVDGKPCLTSLTEVNKKGLNTFAVVETNKNKRTWRLIQQPSLFETLATGQGLIAES